MFRYCFINPGMLNSHVLHFRGQKKFPGNPHQHKYMYDEVSITQALESSNFSDIRRCAYGTSHYIPEISDVEGTAEGVPAIYFEAKNP